MTKEEEIENLKKENELLKQINELLKENKKKEEEPQMLME